MIGEAVFALRTTQWWDGLIMFAMRTGSEQWDGVIISPTFLFGCWVFVLRTIQVPSSSHRTRKTYNIFEMRFWELSHCVSGQGLFALRTSTPNCMQVANNIFRGVLMLLGLFTWQHLQVTWELALQTNMIQCLSCWIFGCVRIANIFPYDMLAAWKVFPHCANWMFAMRTP